MEVKAALLLDIERMKTLLKDFIIFEMIHLFANEDCVSSA